MAKIIEKFRDATARKPSGWLGKCFYKDPKAHKRSFEIIIKNLTLKGHDVFLEVACGGGVLLEMALETVGRAAAIDHSADMVALAKARNKTAVDGQIVEIIEANAESLPWVDGHFSCAACANAFFFMEHPQQVLNEIFRVLGPKGRLVMTTFPDKFSLVGIFFKRPYHLKTYPDQQMRKMLYEAGFRFVELNTVSGMQVCVARKP